VEVLFLTQTYPRLPGDTAGPFIRDLARALVRGGDRVTVLAPHAPGVLPGWDDDGVEVETFRYAPAAWEVLGYSRSLEADETVKAGALAVTPLYLRGAARAVSRLLRRREGEGRPLDLVHAHWVVPNAPPAAWAAGSRAKPPALAVGLHGSGVFLAERAAVRPFVRWALRRAQLLTGCSPELVDRVVALGFPAERSRVIPYGVDTALFAPVAQSDAEAAGRAGVWRRRLGVPSEAPLGLGLGRMATKKGFHVLLDALPGLLAAAPDSHWVLAGGGGRLEEYRRRAAAMPGGERVHFPGSVERGTLPDLFRAADLFVLPAVHDARGNVDGLPNVILEAMATGLPVVASGISGIPLAVVDGETGHLVPEGEPGPLGDALLGLVRDPARRRALGAAGRARAVARLTWDAVAARYREGYTAALAGATP
jgi:glycosyltransferase involved in cell wall biosynthesis